MEFSSAWHRSTYAAALCGSRQLGHGCGCDEVGMSVSQNDPELRITRNYQSGDTAIFFTDGRNETNPDTIGHDTIKSNTRWTGRKLISRYVLHRSFRGAPEVVDVIDEWTISKDGKKLTRETSMRYLLRATDAAHREPFRGYVPKLWLKRVYDRV